MKRIFQKLPLKLKLSVATLSFVVSMIMFYSMIKYDTGFVFGFFTGIMVAVSAVLFAFSFEIDQKITNIKLIDEKRGSR